VKLNKVGEIAQANRYAAGFSIDTELYRAEFKMLNGIPFVSDKVKIHIEVEGVRQNN